MRLSLAVPGPVLLDAPTSEGTLGKNLTPNAVVPTTTATRDPIPSLITHLPALVCERKMRRIRTRTAAHREPFTCCLGRCAASLQDKHTT